MLISDTTDRLNAFSDSPSSGKQPVRLIAFYLPQYHPIPENDEWWGKGFTEWTNVTKAKPLFPGHYQPHLPADMGFYDLRLPEAREAQADLARSYGIHGFCYYHYWFNGRRILERPFNEVLASGKPNFPFCLCWANENWTRRWDGLEQQILLGQQYNHGDDLAHINSLLPALGDDRYIRVNGKALLLIWRTEMMPDPAHTAEIWREAVMKAGLGELFLVRVEGFTQGLKPKQIGFDASVEFAPDWHILSHARYQRERYRVLRKLRLIPKVYDTHRIFDYDSLVTLMLEKPLADYKRFRSVAPSWDNTARRAKGGTIFRGATPEKYEEWLSIIVKRTVRQFQGEERLIFINAWNEWAEGCHLEPDQKFGRQYLEATKRALTYLEALPDMATQTD